MRPISSGIPILVAIVASLALPPRPAAQEQPRGERAERVQVRSQSPGWFGFAFSPVAENGGRGQRVAVVQVEPNSGAARGGLQQGDTIIRWASRTDVATALQGSRFTPDESVRVRVRRNGRERDLTLVAGARPRSVVHRSEDGRVIVIEPGGLERRVRVFTDSIFPRFDSLGIHADSLHRRLRVMLRDSLGPQLRELERLPGMRFEIHRDSILARGGAMLLDLETGLRGVAGAEFTELNPELAAYFSADRGVLVLRVAPDTPAARAGLQAGDVVRRVNGRSVERVAELRSAINRATNRAVELEIVRRGTARNVRMSWE